VVRIILEVEEEDLANNEGGVDIRLPALDISKGSTLGEDEIATALYSAISTLLSLRIKREGE
jgi:hypothetical protein